jgi:hypothetical protein
MRSFMEFEKKMKIEASDSHGNKHDGANLMCSTSEEAKLRALSLMLIRSIVQRHGGRLTVDLATDTINIEIPEETQAACAREIEEQVGAMCR